MPSCLPISDWEIQFPTVPQVVFCICSSISSLSTLKSRYSAVDVQDNGSSYLLYIFLSTSSRHRHYNMSDVQNQLVISHICICLHVLPIQATIWVTELYLSVLIYSSLEGTLIVSVICESTPALCLLHPVLLSP